MELGELLVGGAASRPDSLSGMNPAFSAALQRMIMEAPAGVQEQFRINSGYRSPEVQAQLWKGALAKYGSEAAARKWVAPPGRSQHGHGNAADLKYLSDTAREYAHANAAKYGLAFPLGNEPWHVELAGARGGGRVAGGGGTSHIHGGSVGDTLTGGAPDAATVPNPRMRPNLEGLAPLLDPIAESLSGRRPMTVSDLVSQFATTMGGRATPNDPLAGGVPAGNPNRYFLNG